MKTNIQRNILLASVKKLSKMELFRLKFSHRAKDINRIIIFIAVFLISILVNAQNDNFTKNWDLPGWSGVTPGSTSGNPHIDSDGNTWGAYGKQFTGSGYQNWSGYTLMQWITNWNGTWTAALYGSMPRFYSSSAMLAGYSINSKHNGGALTFTPATTGSYSMYGKFRCADVDGPLNSGLTHIAIGKMNSSNSWTELFRADIPHQQKTVDLSTVDDLQNIFLNTNDKLMIVVWADMGGHSAYAVPENVGIGYNRLVYKRDFENLSLGTAGSSVVVDNTWTGDPTPQYTIVNSQTSYGKALKIGNITNFAQMFLSPYPDLSPNFITVNANKKYRIRGSLFSSPPMNLKLSLRKSGHPYPPYVLINMKSDESWRKFDYVVACGNTGGSDARIILLSNNSGDLMLGDLKIIEYPETWSPAPQAPPQLNNMIQNSSFELGIDGWSVCNGTAEIDETLAAGGRRSLCLTGKPILSSSCYPVGLGQSYTLSASVRADYPNASILLRIAGTSIQQQSFNLLQNTWQNIEFTKTLNFPSGINCTSPYATVWVAANIPEGKHIWIDNIDLHFGPSATYTSSYTMETALSTNLTENLVVAGNDIILNIENIEWANNNSPLTMNIDCKDRFGTVVNTWSISVPVLSGYEPPGAVLRKASLNIGSLEPGYWRFVTRTSQDTSAEGEILISCVPELPENNSDNWQAGTHARTYARVDSPGFPDSLYQVGPQYGLRWARLHDVGGMPKWNYVEPQQGTWDWTEADDTVNKLIAAGYKVLGVLDGVPAWRMGSGEASSSAMKYPDNNFADWENYVKAAVEHFQGRIDHWEVINEPIYYGTPERYVELLEHAYDAAKIIDSDVKIIGGGGAIFPVVGHSWTSSAIASGLFSFCDAISYHGYGNATTRLLAGPQPLVDFMDWIELQMTQKVGKILPVWDTEVGISPSSSSEKFWLPNREIDDPLTDAKQLVVTLLSEKFANVKKTFFYAAFPYCLSENISYYMFSDINSQLTPLTTALGVLMDNVGEMESAGFYSAANATVILRFSTRAGVIPHKEVYCIWTLKNSTPTNIMTPLSSTISAVSAVDLFGKEVQFTHQSNSISVNAGPEPIYISLTYKRWELPGWSGITPGSTSGNPHTDSDGNTWGAYGKQFTGNGYQNWTGYTLMQWITNWNGTWTAALYGSMPRFYSSSAMLAGYSINSKHNGGALVFTPATAGSYSMDGKFRCADVDGPLNSGLTHIAIGKMDSSNNWTELFRADIPHLQKTVELATIDDLQNISLNTNDKLMIVVWADMGGHSAYAVPENVGISR